MSTRTGEIITAVVEDMAASDEWGPMLRARGAAEGRAESRLLDYLRGYDRMEATAHKAAQHLDSLLGSEDAERLTREAVSRVSRRSEESR